MGSILAVIGAIALILGLIESFFNITGRFKKWKEKSKKAKFKETYIENRPDFEYTFGYISNPPPGKCKLSIGFKNVSNEIKFIEMFSYNFEFKNNKNHYLPPLSVLNGEKWPKRLEHGERFHISMDFENTLYNSIFDYWKKDVQVYSRCNSSTGDLLRSNSVDFDVLTKFIEPLNEHYQKLALKLSKKFNGSQRDIEVSLWQLQLFKRITVHIAKQFHNNNIPILEYLVSEQNIVLGEGYFWSQLYSDLEKRKISSNTIESFLKTLV